MLKRTSYMYKGWRVYDNGEGHHPVTGRWRAFRFGVGMGHNNEAGLRRMIDTRPDDTRAPAWLAVPGKAVPRG